MNKKLAEVESKVDELIEDVKVVSEMMNDMSKLIDDVKQLNDEQYLLTSEIDYLFKRINSECNCENGY